MLRGIYDDQERFGHLLVQVGANTISQVMVLAAMKMVMFDSWTRRRRRQCLGPPHWHCGARECLRRAQGRG